MWRIFSLAILALIPVGRVGAQDKRSLIVEVLQTAGDYGDIAPVWGIVQKDGDIYRFVPSVAPLKEKYRISDRYGYRTHPISGERQFRRPGYGGGVCGYRTRRSQWDGDVRR